MKWMNWNNDDLDNAPTDQVSEIVQMMVDEAEEIRRAQQFG